jgi:hypothetical protein
MQQQIARLSTMIVACTIVHMDFLAWCDEQDPDVIPYRPGARQTAAFGLRRTDIGSPAHLGTDRGASPAHIVMPFYTGQAEWQRLPESRPWGSFLRIHPAASTPVELHVGHTEPTDTDSTSNWAGQYHRNERLPARAGDLGLSTGPHTHTELVVGFDEETLNQLRKYASVYIVENGSVNGRYVAEHCRRNGMVVDGVMDALEQQIDTWGIREMSDIHAVRMSLPHYRRPRWGDTAVILVDSHWALRI